MKRRKKRRRGGDKIMEHRSKGRLDKWVQVRRTVLWINSQHRDVGGGGEGGSGVLVPCLIGMMGSGCLISADSAFT